MCTTNHRLSVSTQDGQDLWPAGHAERSHCDRAHGSHRLLYRCYEGASLQDRFHDLVCMVTGVGL